MARALFADTRLRRLALAALVYALTTAAYFGFAARSTLVAHTPFNHFALLAEGWLQGRLDLGGPPPGYAGNNDFAEYHGKWFVTFPPFPAVLLLPLVALAGSAKNVQDGQFFLWLAGIAPAVLFLALEKLRRMGVTGRDVRTSWMLSLLFAFGTVYFFSAVQGTVWFAAHVVAAGLAALYLLFSLGAERPMLAGLMLGLAFMTRSPLLFAFPLFVAEAVRVSLRPGTQSPPAAGAGEQLALPLAKEGEQLALPLAEPAAPARGARPGYARELWERLDKRRLVGLLVDFSLPLLAVFAIAVWHNHARFGNAFDFGYRFLAIRWRARMDRWGLFDFHYLGRNLAVVLTSLPWVTGKTAGVPFQINSHGLALWVTTPAYLWLLWPRRRGLLHWALWLSVAAVAVPTLFYQNTGWVQFGYRFSNDYSVFLFALLAIGGYRFGVLFQALAVWSVVVNAFGAATFDRPRYRQYYYQEPSQQVLHQPD
jgi:hypothetical protein